jgi:hypothetical protein
LNIAVLPLLKTMNSVLLDGTFIASEESSSNSDKESESETLTDLQLEKGQPKAGRTTKHRKKTNHPMITLAKKR